MTPLGVGLCVSGLPTNSRVRKLVKTRVADTEKRYEQHYAGTGKKATPVRYLLLRSPFMGRRTPRHCALYGDLSERPSQQVSLRENLLRPWSGRKLHQELETPSRLQSHIMLKGQPDAASDPPLRLLADVGRCEPPARKRSRWRRAQFDTLRLNLIRITATVVEKKTRIIMSPPASCPQQSLIRLLFEGLAPPHSA